MAFKCLILTELELSEEFRLREVILRRGECVFLFHTKALYRPGTALVRGFCMFSAYEVLPSAYL